MLGQRRDEQVQKILEQIEEVKRELASLKGERRSQRSARNLEEEISRLRKELVDTQIEKDRVDEEHEKRERETRHKVGLAKIGFEEEKKRHEKDIEVSKKEARLEIREQNLVEAEKQFKDRVAFLTQRFEKESEQREEFMRALLDRLPNVNAQLNLHSGNGHRDRDED